jgi:hypothetical protein
LEVDRLAGRGALGARWGRDRLGAGVKMSRDLVVETVHQMPVSVHRHRDRSMAETSLDCLGMLSVGDQPGGVGVAKIVDPARRTD